jgi:hypothetical protein
MGANPIEGFEARVETTPDDELSGTRTALSVAIAEAAMAAAGQFHEVRQALGLPEETEELSFNVSHIEVTVRPNPGPTSYKVIITPTG